MLEWVAISFSRGTSQIRDQTHVSCLGDGFFIIKLPRKPTFRLMMSKYLLTLYFLCLRSSRVEWRPSQVALMVKNLPASVGDVRDMGLIPG